MIEEIIDRYYQRCELSRGEIHLPEFPADWSGELEDVREYLDHGREILREAHQWGQSGVEVARAHALLIDQMLAGMHACFEADFAERYPKIERTLCLVALGGYGRRELNPHSDVDLLFLHGYHRNQYVETISERILYLLWDLQFQVGYAHRSIKDCVKLAADDVTIKTNLLDQRLIAGTPELHEEFETSLRQNVFAKNKWTFLDNKLEERDKRLATYFESVYILEPQVKEGRGGLRDLHTIRWILNVQFGCTTITEALHKGVISQRQYRVFTSSLEMLLRTRNDLHFAHGRQNDRLTLVEQRRIAAEFGYTDDRNNLGVELFMRDYFAMTDNARVLLEELIDRLNETRSYKPGLFRGVRQRKLDDVFVVRADKLTVVAPEEFDANPLHAMRAFVYAVQERLPLDSFLRSRIEQKAVEIDEAFCRNPEAASMFLGILRSKRYSTALKVMHETGFLSAYIPEWRNIYHQVQFDSYHLYTVDVHTLNCLRQLERLTAGDFEEELPELTRIAQSIENRDVMALAVLFHDIGKGHADNHSVRGANMMPEIGDRLGLSEEETELLRRLVLEHLVLSHTSQRRDIHDPKVQAEVIEKVDDLQTLKMLYVLTACDIRGTGPKAWTGWKKSLLQELYETVHNRLEQRDRFHEDLERTGVSLATIKKRVAALAPDTPKAEIDKYFKLLPKRYFFATSPHTIVRHLELNPEIESQEIVLRPKAFPEKGYIEAIFAYPDQPEMFSNICGVFSLHGINILGAVINTRSDGMAFDVFYVSDVHYGVEVNSEKWQRIQDQLAQILTGKADIGRIVEKSSEALYGEPAEHAMHETRVRVFNDLSDFNTVLEVESVDRLGLLYDITRTLSDLRLNIFLAKIVTNGNRIIDVFYLRDALSQKIMEDSKLEEIRVAIERAVDEVPPSEEVAAATT